MWWELKFLVNYYPKVNNSLKFWKVDSIYNTNWTVSENRKLILNVHTLEPRAVMCHIVDQV